MSKARGGSPRKFAEKIALLNKKEAESTAEFEKIIFEVEQTTRTSPGVSTSPSYKHNQNWNDDLDGYPAPALPARSSSFSNWETRNPGSNVNFVQNNQGFQYSNNHLQHHNHLNNNDLCAHSPIFNSGRLYQSSYEIRQQPYYGVQQQPQHQNQQQQQQQVDTNNSEHYHQIRQVPNEQQLIQCPIDNTNTTAISGTSYSANHSTIDSRDGVITTPYGVPNIQISSTDEQQQHQQRQAEHNQQDGTQTTYITSMGPFEEANFACDNYLNDCSNSSISSARSLPNIAANNDQISSSQDQCSQFSMFRNIPPNQQPQQHDSCMASNETYTGNANYIPDNINDTRRSNAPMVGQYTDTYLQTNPGDMLIQPMQQARSYISPVASSGMVRANSSNMVNSNYLSDSTAGLNDHLSKSFDNSLGYGDNGNIDIACINRPNVLIQSNAVCSGLTQQRSD